MRIIWANSVELCSVEESGVQGTGVYATLCRCHAMRTTMSRINHSCSPNCHVSWEAKDRRRRTKVVRACTSITEGEEITWSYICQGSTFPSREERGARLANWFPECRCKLCGAGEEEVLRSDELRRRLARLHAEVKVLAREGRVREAVEVAGTKVALMRTVGEELLLQVGKWNGG